VLATRTAKCNQRKTGRVDSLADRDMTDGLGHALVGDPQQALEDLLVAAGAAIGVIQLSPEFNELGLRRVEIDGNRKPLGDQPAEQQIDIGQRQRSAGAIARRSRHRAGALRADRQSPLLHPADRAATGGHRFDGKRRNGQLHRADLVRKDVLEVAVKP
jgi:hypothetical protein